MITFEYLQQLAKEQNIKINLKEEFFEKIDWYYISINQKLSEEFIREFQDKVSWYDISQYQQLSEEFIKEFQDKVAWNYIPIYQKLSEDFIREFKDKVNWLWISIYQKLSEKFIIEFKDKVDWICISKYQQLSENFIREFQDKIDWYCISRYQYLSEEFRKEFNIQISPYNWLYKSKEDKLAYIKANTNYEVINDEYILAYKSVRSDNYSLYNFQYQYLPGNTYEAHCDCNIDDYSSFGLSAWTKEKALEYYSKGKLLLVKINIEDIGAIVRDNQKIRCRKLSVIKEL